LAEVDPQLAVIGLDLFLIDDGFDDPSGAQVIIESLLSGRDR